MAKRNKKIALTCPFEATMDILAGKWKGIILFQLLQGEKRFGELKSAIPSITQRMLTLQIRSLECDGLIEHKFLEENQISCYGLSEKGKNFMPIYKAIEQWGKGFS